MARYDEREVTSMEDVIKELGLEKIEEDEYAPDIDTNLVDEEYEKKSSTKSTPSRFDEILKKAIMVGAVIIVVLIVMLILALTGVIGS